MISHRICGGKLDETHEVFQRRPEPVGIVRANQSWLEFQCKMQVVLVKVPYEHISPISSKSTIHLQYVQEISSSAHLTVLPWPQPFFVGNKNALITECHLYADCLDNAKGIQRDGAVIYAFIIIATGSILGTVVCNSIRFVHKLFFFFCTA